MFKASIGLIGLSGSAWGWAAATQAGSTAGILAAAATTLAAVILLALGAKAVLRD
ncbi:hypothetical protein [Arthrobacter sp. STN4]|uniref:hypothetical protein n=1 Tax=Arthrobacter sp. STN4 TaxID=2923276 RepID=UPI00211A58E6|nr:hypothetical protein [Arthrobacter sp. STN4]MCQ9162988.1 hypothetical protein [Arthrobacter sp. STN4]